MTLVHVWRAGPSLLPPPHITLFTHPPLPHAFGLTTPFFPPPTPQNPPSLSLASMEPSTRNPNQEA